MNFKIDHRVWRASLWPAAACVISALFFHSLVFFAAAIFIGHLLFFRDPGPKAADPAVIFSPASGTVVEITEEEEDRFLKENSVKIGIFLSIFDVHVNRTPVEGSIGYLQYVLGQFKNALDPESSRMNESNWIGIENKNGRNVLVRQISGAIARRIHWDVQRGQTVKQGEKLGIICYGSRVECFLPKALFNPAIQLGARVKVGQTILGEWKQ